MSDVHDSPGLACQLAQLARSPYLHVYICQNLREYRRIAEELAFFLQDAPQLLWRFPAWEVLPYDRVSPHHAIVGERFSTLARLLREPTPCGLLLTVLPAWLHRIAPPESTAAHVWQLHTGDALDISRLKERLALAGMRAADRVLEAGEFSARGGILDIWPATESAPLRVDMFGDEIETIRRFDTQTQRSGEHLDAFTSVPVREVILDETGRQHFTAAFRARFPHLRKHPMLAAATTGRPHPGIESLLPLAYANTARLIDYLPDTSVISAASEIEADRFTFAEQVRAQFEMVRMGVEPVISPQELYAVDTPVHAQTLTHLLHIEAAISIDDMQDQSKPLHTLIQALRARMDAGWKLLLVAHGPGQQVRMTETCVALASDIPVCTGLHDMHDVPIQAAMGFLDAGFALSDARILVLTGRELLGQRLPRRRGSGRSIVRADVFANLRQLHPNDPVVHEDHGVGRYLGLTSMDAGGVTADFLHIEYADHASIYLPVEELDHLHRYTGEDAPKLNKLGAERWKRARERVKRDLLVMAHELVEVEAKRRGKKRTPCILTGDHLAAYEEFCTRFPFEETDDQATAIDAVVNDLAKDQAMDRVVCGDVGFGKTEVALRAAFIVAKAGRQVILLAPTTVLAHQHFSTFSDRFAGTNIRIACLSRMQGKKETEQVRQGLVDGEIHIMIGTHRLLSADMQCADPGMVIVDEEQRFGVRQKERLKALYEGLDLLTLSATPIPRTLHQSLSGLREISIISTPPDDRESIRTMVATFDEHLICEAIRRELYRGGQAYYLHNHVKSIERIAERLRELVPEAEIGVAHGQMAPAELDRQMLAFYEGRQHILVCTTIIESGLDVPNANTLIVERADLLGLAQLHQIRGRVGRSHRQAYAYLFTPDARAMTPDARDRLQAIAEHTELGAGFQLARHDMEIRGAGNLLGTAQSGHIDAIGLDMYLDMLSKAVEEARGHPSPVRQSLELDLHVNAILPPDYIPQIGERLALYKRIAAVQDDTVVAALQEEMTDRFGSMPEEARFCLEAARIRWRARRMGMPALRATAQGMCLHFSEHSPMDPVALLARVQSEPGRFRLTPDGKLTLLQKEEETRARLDDCIAFLDTLLEDSKS